LNEKLNDKVHI
jgi:hypothetical protein